MNTATRTPKKADPAAKLERLDAATATARAERDRIKHQYREYEAELAALDREAGAIAREDPTQFDATAQPKAGSDAAKLTTRLHEARASSPRWAELLAGAEAKVREAEQAAAQHRADHAVELARIEFEGGEADLAELDKLARPMLDLLARIRGRDGRLVAITSATPGSIDGRDVTTDSRLDALEKLLSQHPTFTPPRSRSLTPLEGEVPPTLRSTSGGFIKAGHRAGNYQAEQPERIEARR